MLNGLAAKINRPSRGKPRAAFCYHFRTVTVGGSPGTIGK